VTAKSDIACVLDGRSILGEGPFWDVSDRRLYWVDIKSRLIHRYDPGAGMDEVWPTPEDVGSVAPRENGGLVVALKSGFHFYDLGERNATPVAIPEGEPGNNRFNDGKTDRQGRFWAGSMDDGEKLSTGGLYCLELNLKCRKMVDGIVCSNALCWSPDSRTMYYADSGRRTVWAWDFDPTTGDIANRRVFVTLAKDEGIPDGATVDSEGFIWIAQWGGWRVVRYDPAGKIARTIMMPIAQPTCPAFGGNDLDVMYVTSASIHLTDNQLTQQPRAGGLFAVDAGVKGLPEVRFKG
jgi:L-arabinonolactonase